MVYGGYNLRCPQKLWNTIESLWTRYDIGEHDGLGPTLWVGHMVGTNALRNLPLHSECEEMVYGGYNLRCPQKLWIL